MEVNQLMISMTYGDAIGNSTLNIKKVLNAHGVKSEIYARNIHPYFYGTVHPVNEIPLDRHVIYHMSIGCELNHIIPDFTGQRWMIYHNITPDCYFEPYDSHIASLCKQGRTDLAQMRPYIHMALADSEYNRQELLHYGYGNTATAPIILDFDDYDRPTDTELLHWLAGSKQGKDILFVGRIVPNKKIEDVVHAFAFYQKHMQPQARLFLVGTTVIEAYTEEIKRLARQYLLNIHLVGHVSFEQLLAYYRNADLFLCMSEHEGFCVPLLEAMHFNVPIVAYNSSAVGETLGSGGLLVSNKDWVAIAALMNQVLEDDSLKMRVLNAQRKRRAAYSKTNTQKIWWDYLQCLL